MKEHIMENGDYAIVTSRHSTLKGCIIKIIDCVSPARIIVRVCSSPQDDVWFQKFPTWYVTYDLLEVIYEPGKITQLEAEICLKNL